jgi:hypothetical protein
LQIRSIQRRGFCRERFRRSSVRSHSAIAASLIGVVIVLLRFVAMSRQ